ncbi:hypothetical protein ABMB44_15635 [Levilactobacillus brevis]
MSEVFKDVTTNGKVRPWRERKIENVRRSFFMSEVFKDVTTNGKVRPWRERKIENVRYAEYLSILEFKRAHDFLL